MTILEIIRVILGSVLFLFIPGLTITLAIFPRKEIDLIERITLSFAFSISVVPLLILILNQSLGVETFPIDLLHSLIASLSVIILSLLIWFVRTRR